MILIDDGERKRAGMEGKKMQSEGGCMCPVAPEPGVRGLSSVNIQFTKFEFLESSNQERRRRSLCTRRAVMMIQRTGRLSPKR